MEDSNKKKSALEMGYVRWINPGNYDEWGSNLGKTDLVWYFGSVREKTEEFIQSKDPSWTHAWEGRRRGGR